jgi:hypothetical protein
METQFIRISIWWRGELYKIYRCRTEEGRMVQSIYLSPTMEKILLASDLSQAEARVVAWEAEDVKKIELFLDPHTDVHWENAKIIFKYPGGSPLQLPRPLFKDYLH